MPSKPPPSDDLWRSPWPNGVRPAQCELCGAPASVTMVMPQLAVCIVCAGRSLSRVADAMLDCGIRWQDRIPPIPE